ncbi:hypothetical protein ASG90_00410 [Nocardioides sp. Soil797]|nr:hypothetical protein ASG90_00410 [Nocardioides sp. Soil797]
MSICVELVLLAAAVPLIRSAHGEYVANATDETGEAALEGNIAFMVLALVVLFAILGVIALFCLLIGVLVRGNSRTTRVLIGCGVAIAVVEVAIAVTVGVLYFNVP